MSKEIQKSVPQLILGTAMWGWTVPPERCFRLLDEFYRLGFREVDAAANYPINKRPEDFRRSEQILQQWIATHGIKDLRIMMKAGSINNLKSPENNLRKSFLLMIFEDYRNRFGDLLETFMIHWDNRREENDIRESLEALDIIRKAGLRIGVSGIRQPEIYARLNRVFDLNFRIQIKHNLLHSDYARYRPFHGKRRFIAYGINAGGLKIDPRDYRNDSSLEARGGNSEGLQPILSGLHSLIDKANARIGHPLIKTFNQCGLAFAFYSPDIEAILLGTSSVSQLKESYFFYRDLIEGDYRDFFQDLKTLHFDHVSRQ